MFFFRRVVYGTASLDVTLIEYDGGHVIPEKLLEKIVDDLNN